MSLLDKLKSAHNVQDSRTYGTKNDRRGAPFNERQGFKATPATSSAGQLLETMGQDI